MLGCFGVLVIHQLKNHHNLLMQYRNDSLMKHNLLTSYNSLDQCKNDQPATTQICLTESTKRKLTDQTSCPHCCQDLPPCQYPSPQIGERGLCGWKRIYIMWTQAKKLCEHRQKSVTTNSNPMIQFQFKTGVFFLHIKYIMLVFLQVNALKTSSKNKNSQ